VSARRESLFTSRARRVHGLALRIAPEGFPPQCAAIARILGGGSTRAGVTAAGDGDISEDGCGELSAVVSAAMGHLVPQVSAR
jgi:hypothetical protein